MRSKIDNLVNNKIFDEIRSEHEHLVKGEHLQLKIDVLKIRRSELVDYDIPRMQNFIVNFTQKV